MSDSSRHGDYIGARAIDINERHAECTEDDALEGLTRIELNFELPITMTQAYQRRLVTFATELVGELYNQPKEGVHWAGFFGPRLTFSSYDNRLLGKVAPPGAVLPADGQEPTSEDDVFVIGTTARGFGWTKERERALAEREKPQRKTSREWVEDVADFHGVTDAPDRKSIGFPDIDRVVLRKSLIREEVRETLDALSMLDMVETADGIVDSIYVLVGTALELGLPLQALWEEVQRSNLSKAVRQEDGSYKVLRRDDGKILKPEGWTPPDIAGVLRAHGWKG